jgi:hypothetical protein
MGVNQESRQIIIREEKAISNTLFSLLFTSLSNGIVLNEIIGI